MKKLSSIELFRLPNHNHYTLIEGDDFISSGVVVISRNAINPGTNFKSKGLVKGKDEEFFSLREGVDNVSLFRMEGTNMESVVDSYLEESGEQLYKVKLTGITRDIGVYASYSKGFIFLPSSVMEFIIKNLSGKEKLLTNGRTLFVKSVQTDETLIIVETLVESELTEDEEKLIAMLHRRNESGREHSPVKVNSPLV